MNTNFDALVDMEELANKLDDLCQECYEAGQGDGPL